MTPICSILPIAFLAHFYTMEKDIYLAKVVNIRLTSRILMARSSQITAGGFEPMIANIGKANTPCSCFCSASSLDAPPFHKPGSPCRPLQRR